MDSKQQPDETVITKTLGALEIKSEETGEVEAIVATLGVVDRDSEVITEGAIKDGAKVKLSSYGHDAIFGDMPAGKGVLLIDGSKVVFKGRYFLNTQRGLESFRTIKEMGREQEWSFGFRIIGSEVPDEGWQEKGARRILTKLDAFEVSPVIVGAGIGTRTVDVKSADHVAADERAAAETAAAQARAQAAQRAAEAKETALTESAELRRRRWTGTR